MRYAYHDLGEQAGGATAVVRWANSAANAVLLDPVNFSKYVERWPFIYHAGGRYRHSPAELSIPHDGHWLVVVDLGRHVTDIPPTVEVQAPTELAAAGSASAGSSQAGRGLKSPGDGAFSSAGLSRAGS